MSYKLDCDFAIGDIVEFKDMSTKDKKWIYEENTYIERISTIVFNVEGKSDHTVEIWGELFSEINCRMYFTPDRVVRVVEKSGKPNASFYGDPPIAIGTRVAFEETVNKKEMQIVDEVFGFEVDITDEGIEFRYHLKKSEYHMEQDEIEVL